MTSKGPLQSNKVEIEQFQVYEVTTEDRHAVQIREYYFTYEKALEADNFYKNQGRRIRMKAQSVFRFDEHGPIYIMGDSIKVLNDRTELAREVALAKLTPEDKKLLGF